MKPSNWVETLNCAIEGILWTARTQRHMRYHFTAAVAVLLLALFLRISALDFVLLALAITLVLFAELFNTAVEVLVDMISPEYHPLARRAKDVAAGGVLVASMGAAIMGYLALSGYLATEFAAGFKGREAPPGTLAVVSVLTVVILVVLAKARWGQSMPLHGGMPSGHAAVAFSIATSVILSQAGLVIALLAVALATMVCQSRLLLGIHTLREVIVGMALGVITTLLIHYFFA